MAGGKVTKTKHYVYVMSNGPFEEMEWDARTVCGADKEGKGADAMGAPDGEVNCLACIDGHARAYQLRLATLRLINAMVLAGYMRRWDVSCSVHALQALTCGDTRVLLQFETLMP